MSASAWLNDRVSCFSIQRRPFSIYVTLGVRRGRAIEGAADSAGDCDGPDGSGDLDGARASGRPAKGLRLPDGLVVDSIIGRLAQVDNCRRSLCPASAGATVSVRRKLPSLDGGAGREPDGRAGGGWRSSERYEAICSLEK